MYHQGVIDGLSVIKGCQKLTRRLNRADRRVGNLFIGMAEAQVRIKVYAQAQVAGTDVLIEERELCLTFSQIAEIEVTG
jgi:hypothetical protein